MKIFLSKWTVLIGKSKRVANNVVVPENFSQEDKLFQNRAKKAIYNSSNKLFPAEHESMKVVSVELIREIKGL